MKAILVVLLFLFFLLFPQKVLAQTEYFEATVINIDQESTIIESDGNTHPYQLITLMATAGSLKGQTFSIENGNQNVPNVVRFKKGDKLILTKENSPNGVLIQVSDYSRNFPLIILTLIFVILTILIGGKRGAFALLGMLLTFAAIFAFILPQISNGQNPTLIVSIAALIIIPTTYLLSHGINTKTVAAIISTFIVLIITAFLSHLFIEMSHLSGFVSEEASFLNFMKSGDFDAKGLLFAGIIIALLGILEDISISQSAIVVQLKKANSKLSMYELYKRAMDIGKDHISSMVNTLILVYAGASLPLLLMFLQSNISYNQLFSTELISEEIVRTLTASIGLILAVPITTLITVLIVRRNNSTELNLA